MAGPIATSTFNRLRQYASAGNRVYCYSVLAVSSLAVAETIASIHCAYTVHTEEWPGWVSLGGLDKCPLTVTHPNTGPGVEQLHYVEL